MQGMYILITSIIELKYMQHTSLMSDIIDFITVAVDCQKSRIEKF